MNADAPTFEPMDVARFLTGTSVTEDDGMLRIAHPHAAFKVRVPGAVGEALRLMADSAGVTGGPGVTGGALATLLKVVERVERVVEYAFPDDDGRGGLVVRTMTAGRRFRLGRVEDGTQVRLSRFALMRSESGRMLLESPLSVRKVYFTDGRGGSLPLHLGEGATTVAEAATAIGRPLAETYRMVAVLIGAGFVERVRDGVGAEETEALRQWDFHDLLFHSRSRLGRHDHDFGALYPHLGQIPPRPAVRPSHVGPEVALPVPDASYADQDPPLTTVLEERVSIREHGAEPLGIDQLGEFLHRVARVRAKSPPGETLYEMTSRPYPSGGAVYDLEIYLTIHRCRGLDPGVYHYDPERHHLVALNSDAEDLRKLLDEASMAADITGPPDILITLTSRFPRASWKYKGMAYALTLKNVGVLYQTMYLVATAMRLAISALGAGDSDLSARAFDLDYLEESSVGELVLGSRPSATPGSRAPSTI